MLQPSRYNYQIHDRKRVEAERKSRKLTIALLSLARAILGIVIIALFIYIRNRNKIIELQKIINDLNKLAESLNHEKGVNATLASDNSQSLKEEIKSLLTEIQASTQPAAISDRILKSDAYRVLREYTEKKGFAT